MPDSADRLRALHAAIDGLTYPSESDESFEVLDWADGTFASAHDALLAHVDRARPIAQVPAETFFSQLDTAENAEQYRQLRRTLECHFPELSIFRVGVGEVRVDVYILGRSPGGAWVALHTVSIET
jgi:hypothetical protein